MTILTNTNVWYTIGSGYLGEIRTYYTRFRIRTSKLTFEETLLGCLYSKITFIFQYENL